MFLENTLFGAACATGARFPALVPRINALSAAALGDSEAVDASYKIFTARRDVRFLEMEYAIPRERLGQALRETRDLIERTGWTITFPVEVRVTPASDAWLSTAYGRPTAYLACHVYRRTPNPAYFEGVEEIMTRLGGRPHWGKLHTRTPPICAASIRASPTSSPCATGSTRAACSPTPTWTRFSADRGHGEGKKRSLIGRERVSRGSRAPRAGHPRRSCPDDSACPPYTSRRPWSQPRRRP